MQAWFEMIARTLCLAGAGPGFPVFWLARNLCNPRTRADKVEDATAPAVVQQTSEPSERPGRVGTSGLEAKVLATGLQMESEESGSDCSGTHASR